MRLLLKYMMAACCVATQCFADGVAYIAKEDTARCSACNTQPTKISVLDKHTHNIKNALRKKENVKGRASQTDKEAILKALMGTVVIYGYDENQKSIFDLRDTLSSDDERYRHFEILRLTQALAIDFKLAKGNDESISSKKYDDLFKYSGFNYGEFEKMFLDVNEKHKIGRDKLQQIFKYNCGIRNNGGADGQWYMAFGDIADHSVTGGNGANGSVVFISTYNWSDMASSSVRVRLQDLEGRQRYVVIQKYYYSPRQQNEQYLVRSHPIVNRGSYDRNVDVNIRIVNGDNENDKDKTNVTMQNGDKGESGSVNTHPVGRNTTYSPDNMHIKGMPARPLMDGEIFSFVTRVDGDGKAVDTLHIVGGTKAMDLFREVATGEGVSTGNGPAQTWAKYMSRLQELTKTNPQLTSHVDKLNNFTRGFIPE